VVNLRFSEGDGPLVDVFFHPMLLLFAVLLLLFTFLRLDRCCLSLRLVEKARPHPFDLSFSALIFSSSFRHHRKPGPPQVSNGWRQGNTVNQRLILSGRKEKVQLNRTARPQLLVSNRTGDNHRVSEQDAAVGPLALETIASMPSFDWEYGTWRHWRRLPRTMRLRMEAACSHRSVRSRRELRVWILRRSTLPRLRSDWYQCR
jgi:hypothetical protein